MELRLCRFVVHVVMYRMGFNVSMLMCDPFDLILMHKALLRAAIPG